MNKIPDPLAGNNIIDWAYPVTERLNAIAGKDDASSRNDRNRRSSQHYTFEVRFCRDYSAENGGELRIFINNPSASLKINGSYIDIASGLEQTEEDEHWYRITDWNDGCFHVFLQITKDQYGSISAHICCQGGVTGSTIEIASLYPYHDTDNKLTDVEVRQNIVGAIILNTSGDSGKSVDSCWDISSVDYAGRIIYLKNCYWRRANVFHVYRGGFASIDYTNNEGSVICLVIDEITTSMDSARLEMVPIDKIEDKSKDLEHTYIPLYKIGSGGIVEIDFRNCPIAVSWENYTSPY